jgi:dTDP-glucose 4,6-dehydratase
MVNKTVLLTGAGGFVGSHTLRHILATTDWNVIVIDSFRHKGTTDRIAIQTEGYAKHRVRVITHDLTAPFSKQMVAKLGKIDYIISMASESHVDRSIEEPRDFIENNVHLMLTLLEYAREHPVEKFLQVSTDEVYGPAPAGHNHKENEPHKPSNPYSASKSCQEQMCYAYWRTYDMPIIITNTMNIIGELQDPEKYVPMVIKRVLNNERVTIHASKEGQIGSRYYLHARNQSDALVYILKNIEPTHYGEGEISRYNIVGEKELNNLEMAQLIAKSVGKPLDYELVDFHSSRPGHDLRYALDGTKLAKAGWTAPVPLEESLNNAVTWTLKHPEWLL